MPLPEKIISELSEDKPNVPGWSWRIFMFSLFVLIITFAFYVGLEYGFKSYLNSRINKLDSELKKINESISIDDQNKLILFYSQLENIKKIFSNRKSMVPLFSWLERNTLSGVSFNKFNFNSLNNQLNLGGLANKKEDATNQVLVFQSKPEIENITLNNLSFSQDKWQFDLMITFKKSLFDSNGQ
jgi:hypothetical protein